MKKQNNATLYDDTLSKLKALNELFYSACKDLDDLYENADYKEWSSYSDERHKLFAANDAIINSMVEERKKSNDGQEEFIIQRVCELGLYQAYLRAKECIGFPELYNIYLQKISDSEHAYIENCFKIDELNEKTKPYEVSINDIFKKADEYRIVIDYLRVKRQIFVYNIPFDSLKIDRQNEIVEGMLKSYCAIDSDVRKMSSRLSELSMFLQTTSSLKAYNLKDTPSGKGISNPTHNETALKETLAEANERLIASFQADIDNKIKLKYNIENMLMQLSYEEKKVIELEYFQLQSWNEKTGIPYLMKYSTPQCYRFKRSAFKKMRKMIDNDRQLIL